MFNFVRKYYFIFILIFMVFPIFVFGKQDVLEGKIIKEIRFHGMKRTKEYIVSRELVSKIGEPYLRENLDKEYQELELLDIFSDIKIEPVLENDSVIINYKFIETFAYLPSITAKISDENGISAGGGLKSPNLLGRDIFLSARVVVGGETEVEVWLENPWITGNHLGYKFEYYHRERDNLIADFFETADELYLRIKSNVRENSQIGINLEFINVRSDRDFVTLSPNNSDKVTRIGIFLGYDSRDSFANTHKGWWNEIVFSRELRLFKNSTRFNQLDIDLRRYTSIGSRHTLALFSLNTLRSGEVGLDVAPWQLFAIGGTNTVRGWEFAARKGKNQFINTLEYRITIMRPRLLQLPLGINYSGGMQIGIFADTGIGWESDNQFAMNNFITGFGAGIRFLVPIVGMARLDFGFGQRGKGIMLHLGAFEKPVMARRRVR
jgi:outer membrane protein insertion porin family